MADRTLVLLKPDAVERGLVGEIIIYTQARNLREYRVEKIWERRDDDDRG